MTGFLAASLYRESWGLKNDQLAGAEWSRVMIAAQFGINQQRSPDPASGQEINWGAGLGTAGDARL